MDHFECKILFLQLKNSWQLLQFLFVFSCWKIKKPTWCPCACFLSCQSKIRETTKLGYLFPYILKICSWTLIYQLHQKFFSGMIKEENPESRCHYIQPFNNDLLKSILCILRFIWFWSYYWSKLSGLNLEQIKRFPVPSDILDWIQYLSAGERVFAIYICPVQETRNVFCWFNQRNSLLVIKINSRLTQEKESSLKKCLSICFREICRFFLM